MAHRGAAGVTAALGVWLACALGFLQPVSLAAKKQDVTPACRGYALGAVRLGLSEPQVRRAFRGQPMESSTVFDGSAEVRTYTFSDVAGTLSVRVRIDPGGKSGRVESVEQRILRTPEGGIEALLEDLRGSLGPPEAAPVPAGGESGLVARWAQPACGASLSVERRPRPWWEGGGVVWVLRLEPYAAPAEARANGAPQGRPAGPAVTTGGRPAGGPAESRPPRRIAMVPPEFPLQARGRAREAVVELDVTVDPTGRVRHVRVAKPAERSLGFEEAAIDAVRRWRYEPAMRDGRPVESTLRVRIQFRDVESEARSLRPRD